MGSATTLYVETVSNKQNDTKTDSKMSLGSDRNQYSGMFDHFNAVVVDSSQTMNRIDKCSKKSLALEETKMSAREVKGEFQLKKSKKRLKAVPGRRFKNIKRGKRKRANQVAKRETDEMDDMIFNNEPFDLTDHDTFSNQQSEYHEIKAANQMRVVNIKHNLSKVEEEE